MIILKIFFSLFTAQFPHDISELAMLTWFIFTIPTKSINPVTLPEMTSSASFLMVFAFVCRSCPFGITCGTTAHPFISLTNSFLRNLLCHSSYSSFLRTLPNLSIGRPCLSYNGFGLVLFTLIQPFEQ